ncbi:MAG: UDP-N-acetylglucosamine 1-carboxyvinyltransferase [Eubacteriales bacterium]|nr:UDP-N-acetylglucosamine 1-carboxyvinyltransferase [Eubacteriales bacterium]
MEKYVIHGGKPLYGEVTISGAKNAAVAIVPAALMVDGPCIIENVPDIVDVKLQFEILKKMGVKVTQLDATTFQTENNGVELENEDMFRRMRRLRASYYFIGAELGRYGKAKVAMPGGCNFGGIRPIDQHIMGFEKLGAFVRVDNDGYITVIAPDGLTGRHIYFDVVTVGATMNVMLAAVFAKGQTIMENVAKEPHIVDLANFLNQMGADVRGAGTDKITVTGVERLHGGTYSIIPDQIEAGTYMTAVAACGGDLLIKNIIPKHLECISTKLEDMGVSIEEFDDSVRVKRCGVLRHTTLKTRPYPGFPTDMQPQMAAVMCLADGTSHITEGVWASRFRYADELESMGAHIKVFKETAIIDGVPELRGADVVAPDLRAGAALVVAGLAAYGRTTISQIGLIERGYENLIEKVSAIGGDIRIEEFVDG